MPISTLHRTVLALALVVPLSAAHSTETTPSAAEAGGFERSFEAFRQLPAAPLPGVDGAVDLAAIEHTPDAVAAEPGLNAPVGKALGAGTASYYGRQFDGHRTASGERFDMAALTAAHRTLPFGSKVRITNPANGRSVVVRINDRGPFSRGRLIDVSHAAAQRLGLIARGHGQVELALLD